MSYSGIDYGHGKTNIDLETGIRYGIISANELAHWIWEEFETIYDPHCPHCGGELENDLSNNALDLCEFECIHCGEMIFEGEQYGDEPSSTVYNQDGLHMSIDSYNDVWVYKSPYTTTGSFCSPCAPGAVSLGTDGNVQAYCPPPDWFEDDQPMPYEIESCFVDGKEQFYRNEDGELVIIPQSAIG